jgi:hypothetical protein
MMGREALGWEADLAMILGGVNSLYMTDGAGVKRRSG